MKILFYNHTGQVGGAEGLLLMILARLDRDRFDPVLVCPEDGPLRKMATERATPVETIRSLDARFTWRPDQFLRYLKSFVQVILQIRKKVVSLNPDLIHANSIRAGLVATAATFGLGTRVVWHLHDMLPRHPLSTGIRVFASISRRTRMIAVSRAVEKNFQGRFAHLMKRRVSVVLNAIDLELFQHDRNAGRKIRRELRVREADMLLGIVGRLTPAKGQLELVRAFARALPQIPHATLVIVGAPQFNREHEYLQLLKETVKELGIGERVRILGARNDVAAIMQALDLLVINSSMEAFCLVALEAMASGITVLAAPCGGIPELIEHGKTGWLLPQGDQQALAAAILQLSRQPLLCAQLAERGRQHVNARFSASQYLNNLQTFYQALAPVSASLSLARPFQVGNDQRDVRVG